MERQSPSPGDDGGVTLAFAAALPFLFILCLPTLEAAHGVARAYSLLQKELREETAVILTLSGVAAAKWQEIHSNGAIRAVPGVAVLKQQSRTEELRLLLRRTGTGATVEVRVRPEEEVP